MVKRYYKPVSNFVIRQVERILILLIGVIIAYFVSYDIFPAVKNRTSIIFALFICYAITAYVLLPIGIRVARTLHPPKHVPHFVSTPDGFRGDPVNIAFVGTRHQIITAMKKAGWFVADPKTPKNIFKLIKSFVLKEPYPTAPFSSLYLFGRSQDLGLQKQVEGSSSHRHHVRLWACTTKVDEAFREHVTFWHKTLGLNKNQKLLWIGAAIEDRGLGFVRYNGQLTHSIDPNTNEERDLIIRDLQNSNQVKELRTVRAGEATVTDNRVFGDEMIADGHLKIVVL